MEWFLEHEGCLNISHFKAYEKSKNLGKQEQHIETTFNKMTDQDKANYRLQLASSIKCGRFLLHHGLPFRGHDESENSKLDGGLFSVLIDEARVSIQEQKAVVLRFVDKKRCVLEHFLGLKKVENTTSESLKKALDDLFSKHSLSISMLRGQGYDRASNMKREYNGLKALILKENESAHYIHCFAHQLQLALIAVAKKHSLVNDLFHLIYDIVNTVGGSCKKKDMLRVAQANRIIEDLANEDIDSGQGLNQERVVERPVDVLDEIAEDGSKDNQKYVSSILLTCIQSFDFVFTLHMMEKILEITNDLSQALQRKDQDIENAIRLVDISKKRLQNLKDDGWSSLIDSVSIFWGKHNICILNMDDAYVVKGKSLRRAEKKTNFHHYHVDLLISVIDMQLHELNYRFNESTTKLLLCTACFNPQDAFSSFDVEKLIRFAKFYPRDFSSFDLLSLSNKLENFIMDMRSNVDLVDIKGISDVTRTMVETKRNIAFTLVYKLLCLALILPVATATVERDFLG